VRVRTLRFVALGVAAAVVAGCRSTPSAGDAAAPEPVGEPEISVQEESPEPDPGPPPATVAQATDPVVRVYEKVGDRKPFVKFEHPDSLGTPRVFLVRDVKEPWVHVYLPMRPNGASGWIRSSALLLFANPYRIAVDLSANRLRVYDGAEVIMSEHVATGTGGTPTPTGVFYVTMLVEPPDPGGPYGPYAYGLSAYSEVLFSFGGGEGQVAIHGTNDPSSIGQAVSHGCIRMDNESITKLTKVLPLGTPVRIRR
jgi:lipoprotein-anchoring transpeptidase ErfK/SrfK